MSRRTSRRSSNVHTLRRPRRLNSRSRIGNERAAHRPQAHGRPRVWGGASRQPSTSLTSWSMLAHRWGDVVVDLLPDTFNAVVLGRVRRQEVQHELASRGLDECSGLLARVDAEVVDDDVQPPVATAQRGQRRDEQVHCSCERRTPTSACPSRSFSAPTTSRFRWLPGVSTRLCRPRRIQSSPSRGLRSTSISSA